VLILLFSFTVPLAQEKKPELKWKGSPGAEKYLVIIKDYRGRVVLKRYVRNTRLLLNLKAGTYKARIIGINKFQRRHGVSPWIPIRIRKLPRPFIESINIAQIYPDQRNKKYIIKGKKFKKGLIAFVIQNNKKIPVLLHKVSEDTLVVSFDLKSDAEGSYDFQVQNPNGFIGLKKGLININQRPKPQIDSVNKLFIISEDTHSITIKGQNFAPGSRVKLKSKDREYELKGSSTKNEEKITLTIPSKKLNSGKYLISVISPWNKKGSFKKEFIVVSRKMPAVRSITNDSIFKTLFSGTIIINGDRFHKNAKVYLLKDGSIINKPYVVKDKKTIEIKGDLKSLPEGRYSVVVENPYGTKVIKKNALNVKNPNQGLAGINSLYLGIGYSGSFIFNSWSDTVHHSPVGAFLYVGLDFSLFQFKGWARFINYMGVEYTPQFVWYPGKERSGYYTPQLYNVMNEVGIYGRIPLIKNLFLMIRVGGGISASILQSDALASGTYVSADFTLYGGLGVRYIINYFAFIDFSALYNHSFYKDDNMIGMRLSIMGGIRL